jgi:hypothetical protein
MEFLATAEQDRLLENVLQLADVARPSVPLQNGTGLGTQWRRTPAQSGAGAGHQTVSQWQDVAPSLPQRWKVQRQHAQPVIQVGTEPAFPYFRFEITVAGCHEAGDAALRLVAAQRFILAEVAALQLASTAREFPVCGCSRV